MVLLLKLYECGTSELPVIQPEGLAPVRVHKTPALVPVTQPPEAVDPGKQATVGEPPVAQ